MGELRSGRTQSFLMTASELLKATNGVMLFGSEDVSFLSVSIDSRNVEFSSLFVPLRGKKLDGHRFIEEAIKKGAKIVLVDSLYAKEKKAKTVQVGRKSDGTFAPGNTFGRNPGGRPKDAFSYRAIAKVMASEDPDSITNGVKTLHDIVKSIETTPMEKMKALELLIKLNGNFDPQETKDVSEKEVFNPFENLTEDELRKLAK